MSDKIPAVALQNLCKSYGDNPVLQNLSFEIKAGEIFGLLGPNGAGKSTTINIITGICLRNSGVVNVFGHDVQRDYMITRRRIGSVPQEIISDGYFTVHEIMIFQSGFFGIRKNQHRIAEILKRLELWEHRHKRVEHLSGGMKRRLLIAKALVHDPELIILDEPTAGVDVKLRQILWDYIREHNQRGKAVLLTTHYIEEAEKLCHRIAIMHLGRIVALDTPDQLRRHYHKSNVEEVFCALTDKD